MFNPGNVDPRLFSVIFLFGESELAAAIRELAATCGMTMDVAWDYYERLCAPTAMLTTEAERANFIRQIEAQAWLQKATKTLDIAPQQPDRSGKGKGKGRRHPASASRWTSR